MADGVELSAGAGGAIVSTDDAGASGHVQRVKLALSADGSATHVEADADGLKVKLGTATPSGDNTIGRVKFTDGTDIALISASGELSVLETNSAAILSALGLLSTDAKIDDVITVLQAIDAGKLEEATFTGRIGEVQANPTANTVLDRLKTLAGLLTTIDADTGNLAGILTALETIDNMISGNEAQVDVITLPALPAGNNNIGDVDVASVVPGTGATNLGKAEDGAHTSGDTGVMALGVRVDNPNAARADTDIDYIPFATYRTGSIRTAFPEDDFAALGSNHVKKYYSATGATTDGIVWSPAAGKRWYVTDLILTTSSAATVTFEDDKAGGDEVVLALDLAANSGISHRFATPLFSGEDAADLIVTTTAGNIKITAVGYEI